jgi:S-adenosylmethionine:tRNA ribosyltransferase-isomerase
MERNDSFDKSMHLSEFSYNLPESLIAQRPLEKRDASRLMVVDGERGSWKHDIFRNLSEYLSPGDLLIVNRSQVVPARLFVRRESGGLVEVLFTKSETQNIFRALVRSSGKLKPGELLWSEDRSFAFSVKGKVNEREMRLEVATSQTLKSILEDRGHVPLPPYIRREDEPVDRFRYQTVYAREAGSVAAPTAGLHFDEHLLEALQSTGITVLSLTLHIGPGTFLPLTRDIVEGNTLPPEEFCISGPVLHAIKEGKAQGRRVIAVGTTVTRALEAAYQEGLFERVPRQGEFSGETELFIYPGFEFHIVDCLITNFHLPESSLLLLVCAFLGTEKTLACYREAVSRGYRFYSYGDAMLIRKGK